MEAVSAGAVVRRVPVRPSGHPLELGWHALHVRGALAEARAHYDRAYRQAEQAHDSRALVEAAIGLGGVWVHEHRGTVAAAFVRRRQRRALALAPAGSPEQLQLLLRVTAEEDYACSRHERILAMVLQAREGGDPRILASALSLAHHCLLAPEHANLRRALADEMLEVATVSDRPGDLSMALLWHTVDRFLEGDPHAERALENLTARLRDHPHLAADFVAQALQVMLAVRAGRLTEAEGAASACLEAGETAGDLDASGWYAAHLVAIRWYQGRIGELAPLLERQAHSPALSSIDSATFGALAVAAASTGDRARATLALNRLGGGDLKVLSRCSSWSVALYGAIEAAFLLGDASAARSGYDLLRPFAGKPMMVSLAIACFGSVDHALGLAASTMGERELAVRHLRTAVRANLALGHWPAALHSRYRLGQALACSDDPRDRQEGARELTEAAAEAARRGWSLPAHVPEPILIGPAPTPTPTPARNGTRILALPSVGPIATPPRRASIPDLSSHPIGLHRHGGRWTLQWNGRTAEVNHCIGMLYLSLLLARPGLEISAAELVAGQTQHSEVRADAALSGNQELIDSSARRTYRRRLAQVERDIDNAREQDDHLRLRGLEQERDWILTELSAAGGKGRQHRAFTSNAERARIAVGKAIRRALDRLTEVDPAIGEALRSAVQTGTHCCYRPVMSAQVGGPAPSSP